MKSWSFWPASGLVASNALADDGASFVNGDWIGTGSFQLGGEISACSEVRMIGRSKTTYVVREASMIWKWAKAGLYGGRCLQRQGRRPSLFRWGDQHDFSNT